MAQLIIAFICGIFCGFAIALVLLWLFVCEGLKRGRLIYDENKDEVILR